MGKRVLKIIFIVTFILFLMDFSALAVPLLINYQGKLTDQYGNTLNGNYQMSFSIFNTETDGTALWIEHQTVAVMNGIFNVELGDVVPLSASLFNSDVLYLEVRVGTETLSPRRHLTSVAFAIKAKDADTVGGIQASDLMTEVDFDNEIATHTSDPNAHHTKTISFAELIDTATDAQIPDSITINYANTANIATNADHATTADIASDANYAMDADKVDGKHASEFGDGHSLDADDGSPTDAVYVDNDGKVGIGTTDPGVKLHIVGSSIFGDGSGGVPSSVGKVVKIDYDTGFDFGKILAFDYGAGIPKNLVLQPTGNVGIGTTSPAEKLHVDGSIQQTTGDLGVTGGADNIWEIKTLGGGAGDETINFTNSSGVKRMVWNMTTGNVGIGTTSLGSRLEVDGTVTATAFIGDGSGLTNLSGDIVDVRAALDFIVGPIPPGTKADPYPGSAIQDAIDDLPSIGGMVFISSGVWEINTRIDVPSNTIISGAGSSTVLIAGGGYDDIIISNDDVSKSEDGINGNGNENIVLRDFKLDGSNVTSSSVGNISVGVRLRDTHNCELKNLQVVFFHDFGIHCSIDKGIVIQNCDIDNTGGGNASQGIRLKDCEQCLISNCKLYNNDKQAIFIDGKEIMVSDCIVDTVPTYQGIAMGDLQYGKIVGCVVIGTYTNGISSVANFKLTHCKIMNNYIEPAATNAADGIFIETASTDNLITGNTVIKPNGAGVVLMTGVERTVVIGNKIHSPGTSGITLDPGTHENIVQGNKIEKAGLCGINIASGRQNIIANNHILNCGQRKPQAPYNTYGINLWQDGNGVTCDDNIIIGNICCDNQTASEKTQTYGIRKGGLGDRNLVVGNNVTGNSIGGITGFDSNDVVADNIGYKTENGGVSSVSNAGTIAHGLDKTPNEYSVTATEAGHIAVVTAVDNTYLTIGLHDAQGAITTAEKVSWHTIYRP